MLWALTCVEKGFHKFEQKSFLFCITRRKFYYQGKINFIQTSRFFYQPDAPDFTFKPLVF